MPKNIKKDYSEYKNRALEIYKEAYEEIPLIDTKSTIEELEEM